MGLPADVSEQADEAARLARRASSGYVHNQSAAWKALLIWKSNLEPLRWSRAPGLG
jgi:hypothetical protein